MTPTKMFDGPYLVMDGDTTIYFGVLDGAFDAFNAARSQYSKADSEKVKLFECALVLSGHEAK